MSGRTRTRSFCTKGGIVSFVEHLNKNKTLLHPKPIYVSGEKDGIIAEVALQYNDSYSETIYTFANNINTREGGTHLIGFKSALTRTANNYASSSGILKNGKEAVSGDDIREGLTAVISVKLPNPQFEGQTKMKLGNSEVEGHRRIDRKRYALDILRRKPLDRQEDHRKGDPGGKGEGSGKEGKGTHKEKRRTRRYRPSRKTCRLFRKRPCNERTLYRRR